MPSSLLSSVPAEVMEWKGVYNSDTNTPAITDASGSNGNYYKVTGTTDRDLGSGLIDFQGGGILIHNGTQFIYYPSETGGVGETNDGVNVGTEGVAIYHGKVGTSIQMRSVAAGATGTITVGLDGTNVDLDVTTDSVGNTYLANMATSTIKGRVTAGTGDPEDLTATQVRTLLNVADGAQANVDTDLAVANLTTTTLDVTSSTGTDATIPAVVAGVSAGLMTSAYATKLDGIEAGANLYVHPPHDGDVTGTTTLTIATGAVTNTKLGDMAAYTLKGRNNAALGDPEDIDLLSITEVTPVAGMKVFGGTAAGAFRIFDAGDLLAGGSPANLPFIDITAAPYSATGDSVTDDEPAFTAAVAGATAGSDVYLPPGTYRIASTVNVNKKLRFFGPGTIDCDVTGVGFNVTADTKWDGLTFTSGNTACTGAILSSSAELDVNDCKFTGFDSDTTVKAVYASDCSRLRIENCIFDNIQCLGNAVEGDANGSVRAIYLTEAINDGLISRCTFNNINNHNITPTLIYEDADAIHCHTVVSGDQFVKISDCTFTNCGKRALKLQGTAASQYTFSDSLVESAYTGTTDTAVATDNGMLSVVSVLAGNVDIDNVKLTGGVCRYFAALETTLCRDVTITNCEHTPEAHEYVQGTRTAGVISVPTVQNGYKLTIKDSKFTGTWEGLTMSGHNLLHLGNNYIRTIAHGIPVTSNAVAGTSHAIIEGNNIGDDAYTGGPSGDVTDAYCVYLADGFDFAKVSNNHMQDKRDGLYLPAQAGTFKLHTESNTYAGLTRNFYNPSNYGTPLVNRREATAFLNVLDYGAVGDGTTDCTTAIQAALTEAAAAGTYGRPMVFLPAGTYRTTNTLDVQDRITLAGAGVDATRILFEPTAGSKACIQFSDASPYHWYGGARDLTVRMGTNAYDDLSGIYVQTGAFVRFDNIHINFDGATVKDWYGLRIRGREHIEVRNCKIIAPIGIRFEAESGGVGLDNSNFHNITYLSSSTGTGETATLPFAAVYVDDDCYLQNVSFTGHHSVARKDHAIYWRYAGSIAATWAYDVSFNNWRTENMTDLIASTRIGGNKYEVDLNGTALRTNISFQDCQWHGPQHGVYMQNCNWVRFSNNRFQSANKIAIKTIGANTFWCDSACSYRDTATAELESWWQAYTALSLDSLHDSKEWVLSFPANSDDYFILPHIKRYRTANSVAKTITALQADDYTELTGFNANHEIELIVDTNTTVQHGVTTDAIQLADAANWNPTGFGTLRLRYDTDHWVEVSRNEITTGSGTTDNFVDIGTTGTSKNIDWDGDGRWQSVTINGDATLTFTDPAAPAILWLMITQEGVTGYHNPSWPPEVLGSLPAISQPPGSVTFVRLAFDGTNYHVTS